MSSILTQKSLKAMQESDVMAHIIEIDPKNEFCTVAAKFLPTSGSRKERRAKLGSIPRRAAPAGFEEVKIDGLSLPGAEIFAYKGSSSGICNSWKLHAIGRGLDDCGQYDHAMACYKRSWDEGCPGGARFIARLYRERNQPELAFEWALKGAMEGDIVAEVDVGVHLLNGEGVKQDIPSGLRWLFGAASRESRDALEKLMLYKRAWETNCPGTLGTFELHCQLHGWSIKRLCEAADKVNARPSEKEVLESLAKGRAKMPQKMRQLQMEQLQKQQKVLEQLQQQHPEAMSMLSATLGAKEVLLDAPGSSESSTVSQNAKKEKNRKKNKRRKEKEKAEREAKAEKPELLTTAPGSTASAVGTKELAWKRELACILEYAGTSTALSKVLAQRLFDAGCDSMQALNHFEKEDLVEAGVGEYEAMFLIFSGHGRAEMSDPLHDGDLEGPPLSSLPSSTALASPAVIPQ